MEPGLPAVSTGQSSGGQPSASLVDDQLSSKLSDVLNTNITLSSANTGSPAVSTLQSPSSLPSQFMSVSLAAGTTSSPGISTGISAGNALQTSTLTAPSSLASALSMSPTPLSVAPVPLSVAPVPLSVASSPLSQPLPPVSLTPSSFSTPPNPLSAPPNPLSAPPNPLSATSFPPFMSQTPTRSAGPPPTSGFQPAASGLHGYESHQPHTQPGSVPSAGSPHTGVNIFTPQYDPNAQPSPYSSAAHVPYAQSPPYQGNMHSGYGAATLDMSGAADSSANSSYTQNGQDLNSIIEWIKTNETVYKMMQKAKSGVETVITAMDPQMKDVLYSGGDISIVVASSRPTKVEPVKEAFQKTFGRATVIGKCAELLQDSQPGIAPQPVGFDAGVKGVNERINNLRCTRLVSEQQVCVAVESFIVELQPDMWYDIACLLLSDPVHAISVQTFSQATPVPLEYVKQAQSECPPSYSLSSTGYSVTIGQVMQRQLAVDPSDWHSSVAGVSRVQLLHIAAKQLAFLYQQQLSRR